MLQSAFAASASYSAGSIGLGSAKSQLMSSSKPLLPFSAVRGSFSGPAVLGPAPASPATLGLGGSDMGEGLNKCIAMQYNLYGCCYASLL